MDDLLTEFLTETVESLDNLDVEIVQLEQNPNDPELLGNIFRLVHTIKGTCGFIGLSRLESVAHAGENVLGNFRDGVQEVTPEAVSLILAALDRIKDYMIANGKKGFPPEKLGRAVWTALSTAKPKTRYAVVPGRLMNWTLPGLLPKRTVDGMMAGRLGLKKED